MDPLVQGFRGNGECTGIDLSNLERAWRRNDTMKGAMGRGERREEWVEEADL